MFKDPFVKQTLKMVVFFAISVVLCRVTAGLFVGLMALAGCVFIMQRKPAPSVICFLMLTMLNACNRTLIGASGFFFMASKIGMLAMTLSVAIDAISRQQREKLPLVGMWAYLLVAMISSIDGWMPMISYLKIINFALLLIGIAGVVNTMQKPWTDLDKIRAILMAFCILMIVGSALLYFVPSIGYSNELNVMARYGMGNDAEELMSSGTTLLFNGMTYHSQALGPTVGLCFVWVLCDMLFIERRLTPFHMGTLLVAPLLLYGSRSRTALVAVVFPLLYLYFVCLPTAGLPRQVKAKVQTLFTVLCIGIVVAAAIVEVRDNTISKWLRKTDDVAGDSRSLKEAITASRQGGIAEDLRDFYLSPIFGKGFQVAEFHKRAYESGAISIWTAPIEKGNLWVMVLGEGGVIGEGVFILFMLSFYAVCLRKKYAATGTLMTAFLAANLGEAMFFSPSAMGGLAWVLTGIGGFAIDLAVKERTEMLMS